VNNWNKGALLRFSRRQSIESRRAQASPRVLLSLLLLVLVPLIAIAGTPPSWWTSPDVINGTANDYAAINQGQLKNLATKAYQHLQANLAGNPVWSTTAGTNLTTLVTATLSSTNSAYNYSAVNLGQLKTIAKPFYDVLNSVGYTNSVHTSTNGYPWTGHEAQANDYAMANIGQAKNLFSFDLTGFGPPSGGPTDSWKQAIVDRSNTDQYKTIADITDEDDFDSDGVTNKQEYLNGTDPLNAASVQNPPASQTDALDQGQLKVFTPLF